MKVLLNNAKGFLHRLNRIIVLQESVVMFVRQDLSLIIVF